MVHYMHFGSVHWHIAYALHVQGTIRQKLFDKIITMRWASSWRACIKCNLNAKQQWERGWENSNFQITVSDEAHTHIESASETPMHCINKFKTILAHTIRHMVELNTPKTKQQQHFNNSNDSKFVVFTSTLATDTHTHTNAYTGKIPTFGAPTSTSGCGISNANTFIRCPHYYC